MTVPYTFGTATTSIPLSNLDSNFNTPITLGNTSIYLGNTTTTIGKHHRRSHADGSRTKSH